MTLRAYLIIFDTFEYIVVSKTFIFYKISHIGIKTHFLDQIFTKQKADVTSKCINYDIMPSSVSSLVT